MLRPDEWLAAVTSARDEGFTWYEMLGAYDDTGRSDLIIVTLRLRDIGRGASRVLTVGVERDGGELPDISGIFAGAAWGQRYVHDFYGVPFSCADLRPLLNHEGGAPLRKDFVLGARVVAAPPVAPGRRGQVVGIPDPAVWGDRDPALPPPTAAEILGGSSRRRRR